MTAARATIGIVADVKQVNGEPLHAVAEGYIAATARAAGCLPLVLPALVPAEAPDDGVRFADAASLLDRVDGLLIPGSLSDMQPHLYGARPVADGLRDPQRDRSALRLITVALERDLPLFAICRGMQELNVALGGTLLQAVQDHPERMDHREDASLPLAEQFAPAHDIRLREDGLLRRMLGRESVRVNSLHRQGIDRPANDLVIEALADDGLIEAVRVPGRRFAVGVQWHPEWDATDNPVSHALFHALGEAARMYAGARRGATARGE